MRVLPTAPVRRISLSVLCALTLGVGAALAQVAPAAPGPAWKDLSAGEQKVLAPLQGQWSAIDALRKQKWRDIAALYPNLPTPQQDRLRSRMAEWAAMTPAQRNAARLNYEEIRKVPAEERQARWETYRNLPEAQRRELTAQASQRPASATPVAAARRAPVADGVQPKSNIVPTPNEKAARPQAVAPGTVQAGVGASTRPITKATPTPPRHQQAGLPKIAATPEFIHSETLLPQRGPQGAGAVMIPAPLPPVASAP